MTTTTQITVSTKLIVWLSSFMTLGYLITMITYFETLFQKCKPFSTIQYAKINKLKPICKNRSLPGVQQICWLSLVHKCHDNVLPGAQQEQPLTPRL